MEECCFYCFFYCFYSVWGFSWWCYKMYEWFGNIKEY